MPLALYFKDGKAKVEIAVARGKKTYDKRQALAERQASREPTGRSPPAAAASESRETRVGAAAGSLRPWSGA